MGLSACIGCGLGSIKMLTFISMVAFFVSGIIGYVSLTMTKNQARQSINNQRLHNMQLYVLQLINKKINEKADNACFYLNTAVFILQNERPQLTLEKTNHSFRSVADGYEWYEKLNQVLRIRLGQVSHLVPCETYQKQVDQMAYLIKKTLAKHRSFLESIALAAQKNQRQQKLISALPCFKVLTNPSFGPPKYRCLAPVSWIRANQQQLFLGVVPTIWGGFASMFVFVGGIPNIARELHFTALADFLVQPTARGVEITMAAIVTCYLAFSFLYSSKKGWQRQKLLEKTERVIADEETLLLENSHRLSMLYKVKMFTHKIVSIFNTFRSIEMQLTSQETRN